MKKQMWACLLAMLLVGTILTVYYVVNKNEEEKPIKEEVYGPKTLEQTMYEKIFTLLESTPLPTYHDDNGNPFEGVQVIVGKDSEYDFVQVDVKDPKTGLSYLYMVCDFPFEFDHIKANGEVVEIGNNQTVYKYNTTYAWHDEKTGFYGHVMFGDGVAFKDAQNILLSFGGGSKYDVLSNMDYKKDSQVVRATYALNGEKLQSMVFDYSLDNSGMDQNVVTKWMALYDTYQIENSFSYEYTSKLIGEKRVVSEQDARKSIAMIDQKNNLLVYTDDEIGSIRITPFKESDADLTGEFVKIVDSLK